MAEETTKLTEVSWNLSQSLILQLASLLQQANNHFVNGNILSAFVRMQNVRMLIHHDLTFEEITKLVEMEKEYQGAMLNSGIGLYRGFEVDKEKKKAFAVGRANYINYHAALMTSLKRHGYTISQKENSARMF